VSLVIEPILNVRGLHTFYGDSHVLRGVDFRVHHGESVGLMGRNGMGKSTLLRSVMGIVRASSGDVLVDGVRVNASPTFAIARSGIAYVPEGRGIFPNLTVRENLVMPARRGPKGRNDWTYERVLGAFPRLGERIENGGWELSGGEQQMLTIGRALMTNPDLLILDEATEGLAPLIALEVWAIVRKIRESGIATVIVDKNHKAIASFADRAVVLVKGKVIFDGAGADVRADPTLVSRHLGVSA
jgi:branched-chain amino acid transport system ATP-binding protein